MSREQAVVSKVLLGTGGYGFKDLFNAFREPVATKH